MRTRLFAVPFALLLTFVAGCSDSESGVVSMTEDQRFTPQEITVQAGDTVTWRNDSGVAHTVTAYSDSVSSDLYFSSGEASGEEQARNNVPDELMQPDDVFRFTFDEPGTYEYFCIPHESAGMTGTVIVE